MNYRLFSHLGGYTYLNVLRHNRLNSIIDLKAKSVFILEF